MAVGKGAGLKSGHKHATVTTWKLQAVETLSIPMMCIQTLGIFVWAGSLAVRFE